MIDSEEKQFWESRFKEIQVDWHKVVDLNTKLVENYAAVTAEIRSTLESLKPKELRWWETVTARWVALGILILILALLFGHQFIDKRGCIKAKDVEFGWCQTVPTNLPASSLTH